MKRSKTDQLGVGKGIVVHQLPGSLICPVKALGEYISLRPRYVYNFLIHSAGAFLTKFQFNSVLKKCLHVLNLDNFRITSHSFRIGAATEASRLGLNDEVIKKIGRWKSNRFNL